MRARLPVDPFASLVLGLAAGLLAALPALFAAGALFGAAARRRARRPARILADLGIRGHRAEIWRGERGELERLRPFLSADFGRTWIAGPARRKPPAQSARIGPLGDR